MPIDYLILDSRKINNAATSLFFAIKGPRRDGSQFIGEAYKKSIRYFVVSDLPEPDLYPGAVFLQVNDTLIALQQLAASHRSRFSIPVIGITGSNGKTIVKEWLFQLLQEDYVIARSPKSYNSQIGVPLSVWQLDHQHQLAIFEAGISKPDEMKKLQSIIQPTIGVFTNLGIAHSEGFTSMEEKAREKSALFHSNNIPVIFPGDDVTIASSLSSLTVQPLPWSFNNDDSWLSIHSVETVKAGKRITVQHKELQFSFSIPFLDEAAVANAITCCCVMLWLNIEPATIVQRMALLQTVNMRLELKKGINQCIIINDSYSADLDSLNIALNFLDQQGGSAKRTVILSDFLENAFGNTVYQQIISNLEKHRVNRVIAIGNNISTALQAAETKSWTSETYPTTAEFLQRFLSSQFKEEIILVKGARVFGFERIAQLLELKVHQTVLEINLNAIVHNVNTYRKQLKPTTRIMAMVKAFAYGSGGAEIAGILQFHKVDYLGVAYADEGVELRRAGVTLPIMVLNPEAIAFDTIVEYNLEPDLFSFDVLHAFEHYLHAQGINRYPIHIEVETGMNRLGFAAVDIDKLAAHLAANDVLKVQSVFSHLAASEDPAMDIFTMQQFQLYKNAVTKLQSAIGNTFIQHISNSAAIFRIPQLEMDMVRLGIGMYGIDSAITHQQLLQPAATLKTTIAQLKQLQPGESVGYNRRGIVDHAATIATVRIGYADGYSRRLGNGIGRMWVKGFMAPVIGTVCMDMTMIDVTGIPELQEGDEVIVFGNELPLQVLASLAGTIPYEIMTGISQRVKRVYFEE